ncbi:transmembrane protein, putative [Medicago truncatula]|uniref:Transmembrane protein, putative n=1 Tax=Medicago truncatula TaxID=3880 RepID=A0A072TS77_MEDTR|nr:transmembrane protein, putative [Medicago truncatula]
MYTPYRTQFFESGVPRTRIRNKANYKPGDYDSKFQSLLIFIVAAYPIELVSALNASIPLFPYYCTYVFH